jgi:hypothetical protein
VQDADGCIAIAECIRDGLMPDLGQGSGACGHSGAAAACEFLSEQTENGQQAAIQQAALTFITSELAVADAEDIAAVDATESRSPPQSLAAALLGLLERTALVAPKGGSAVPPLAIARRAEVLLRVGAPERAVKGLDDALRGAAGSHWELWDLRLRILSSTHLWAAPQVADTQTAQSLVSTALERIDEIGRWRLFPRCLAVLLAFGGTGVEVIEALKASLRTSAPAGVAAGEITAAVLGAVRCVPWFAKAASPVQSGCAGRLACHEDGTRHASGMERIGRYGTQQGGSDVSSTKLIYIV